MVEIQHFLHEEHPLKLIEIRGDDESFMIYCNRCGEKLEGQLYYACELCGFFLHKACANLPQEIQHFFHPNHPLFLQLSGLFMCGACRELRSKGLLYRCGGGCDFEMDVDCTQFQPISSEDEGKRILHISHHHPLHIVDELPEGVVCAGCNQAPSGKAYICEPCGFFLDESCANLPQVIQHRCHPCSLTLKPPKSFRCDFCGFLSDGNLLYYSCGKCEFDVHVKCAQRPFVSSHAEAEGILEHFSHHHPLQLVGNNDDGKCQVCSDRRRDLTYRCQRCRIYLHKSCLEVLPPSIEPKSNPSSYLVLSINSGWEYVCSTCFERFSGLKFKLGRSSLCVSCALSLIIPDWKSWSSSLSSRRLFHPCSLTLKYLSSFTCNSCFHHCSSHSYCCQQCDFYLGVQCAHDTGRKIRGQNGHKYFCHRHPLQYLSDAIGFEPSCVVCESLRQEAFYSCKNCDFHIHESCLDALPQKTDHHFNHTFVLLTAPSNICEKCNKQSSGLTFRSIEGSFKLCVQCFLWPKNESDGNGIFRSIHHWHPLATIEKMITDNVVCFLCGGFCLGLVYGCKTCGTFFHKSCAELPEKIRHLCHPAHDLSLINRLALNSRRRSCSFCFKDFLPFPHYGGVYHCKECKVQLDIGCASTLVPSVEYEGHPHFLTVVEKTHGKGICQACDASCEGSDVLFCTECKFSLHLRCGPLPRTIKHPSHVHRLHLQDYYDEDNDETDEFPCHDCENKRDPMERVYICTEGCQMIIELKCAAFEVVQALRGEREDVELRSGCPYLACRLIKKDIILEKMGLATTRPESAFSYREMFESLTVNDRRFLVNFFNYVGQGNEQEDSEESEEPGRAEDEIMLSWDAWRRLFGQRARELSRRKLTKLFKWHDGIAKASDHPHNLPRTLVPIYEEYNRYINEFALTGPIQSVSVIVFHFCAVLYDMHIVRVAQISEEKLRQWLTILFSLAISRFVDMDIVDKLRCPIAGANFVIKGRASMDKVSKKLSEEVERLEEKLQALKERQKEHEANSAAGKLEFSKHHREALWIKYKPTIKALNMVTRARDEFNALEDFEIDAICSGGLNFEDRERPYWDLDSESS